MAKKRPSRSRRATLRRLMTSSDPWKPKKARRKTAMELSAGYQRFDRPISVGSATDRLSGTTSPPPEKKLSGVEDLSFQIRDLARDVERAVSRISVLGMHTFGGGPEPESIHPQPTDAPLVFYIGQLREQVLALHKTIDRFY